MQIEVYTMHALIECQAHSRNDIHHHVSLISNSIKLKSLLHQPPKSVQFLDQLY